MRRLFAATLVLAALAGAPVATAHFVEKGGLQIIHPWAKPADAGSTPAFPTIANEGAAKATLTGVRTPVAERVELRRRNQPVSEVAIAPGETVAFDGEEYAMTLVGLKRPLAEGASFPAAFHFKGAPGVVEVEIAVGETTDLPAPGAGERGRR